MTFWSRLRRWLVGGNLPSWNEQIQVLAPEQPMELPVIRPLRAQRAKRSRVTRAKVETMRKRA